MSMKKDELCKLRVEIQTSNPFRFREIVILVDKPKFLEEVKKIRRQLNIETPLPFKSDKWYRIPTKLAEKFPFFARSSSWWTASTNWAIKYPRKDKILMTHAKRLCQEFNRPVYMVNDIYQAILFGKVIEKRVSVDIIHPKTPVERPYVAIFPTLQTTYEDIKKALDQAKGILKGYPFSTTFNFKVKSLKLASFPGIVEHRDLYWRNMAGESYTQVALALGSEKEKAKYEEFKDEREYPGQGRDKLSRRPYVVRSIQRYKKALSSG